MRWGFASSGPRHVSVIEEEISFKVCPGISQDNHIVVLNRPVMQQQDNVILN